MSDKGKIVTRIGFIGAVASLLFLLMGCNLAQVDSQNQVEIIQAIGTPSHPTDMSPSPIAHTWPESIVEHVRQIFSRGQILGNRSNVFSKIGDSISVSRNFLAPFGLGDYNLGEYEELQAVIDYYSVANAYQGNSFTNISLAATEGWAAWGVLNPTLADTTQCKLGESPLLCEYRLVRPSVALIMYGTNDVGYRSEADYYADLTEIVSMSIENGVVPIISTFPNRPDQADRVPRFNEIVRQVAEENLIPLMDFYSATVNLPNYGLTFDNLHPSAPSSTLGGAGSFSPTSLQYGYTVRNLLALEALSALMDALDL
jgi:GDSL-like Lipase/Acylhydrolase family